MNSTINCLPTLNNLKKWGRAYSDKCRVCGWTQTQNQVTAGCRVALRQSRFNYRHDNILAFIADCLDNKKCDFKVDIPGFQTASGGTIDPSYTVTPLKPDLVIESKDKKTLRIFELTVPGEQNIEERHRYKTNKYSHFQTDITSATVQVLPFEIGANTGYINQRNKTTIKEIFEFVKPDIKFKYFLNNISAIAVLSSYYIYLARNQQEWIEPARIVHPLKK